MFEVIEDFKELHENIIETFHYIFDRCDNITFLNYPIEETSTDFKIQLPNGKIILISHSINTGGELETVHFNKENILQYTHEYHDNRETLMKYLNQIQ